MDADDARLIVEALESLISGDQGALDRLASTAFVHLSRSAARVRALAADWPPAMISADELEAIAKYGSKVLDDGPASSNLIIFVDKMRRILATPGEPATPRNRAERRRRESADRRAVPLAANA